MLHEELFSELAKIMLQKAGWSPQRQYDLQPHIMELQQVGWNPLFPAAYAILTSLGDLSLRYDSSIASAVTIHHLANGSRVSTGYGDCDFRPWFAHKIEEDMVPQWQHHYLVLQGELDICPIGTYAEDEALFVVSDGRIYRGKCYDPPGRDDWPVSLLLFGTSIYDALNTHALLNTSYI